MRQSRPQPLATLFVCGLYTFWRPLIRSSLFRWNLVALGIVLADALAYREPIFVGTLVVMVVILASSTNQYSGQFQSICSLTALEEDHYIHAQHLVRSFVRNHDLTEQDVDRSLSTVYAIKHEIDSRLRRYFPAYSIETNE